MNNDAQPTHDEEAEIDSRSSVTLAQAVASAERRAVAETYRLCGYKKSRTAQMLDISRSTLDAKLRTFGIE